MEQLTAKQVRFVDEYLIDLNATQAAMRAGYSRNSADKIGSQLLGKTGVQNALRAEQAKLSAKVGIGKTQVIVALAAIAFADIGDYVEPDGVTLRPLASLTRQQRMALAHSRQHREGFTIRLHSKIRALDLLAKHLGLY